MVSFTNLYWLRPPYNSFEIVHQQPQQIEVLPGTAVVWFVSNCSSSDLEMEWVLDRPRGVCCAVVLPAPNEIGSVAGTLQRIHELHPNVVLPGGVLATPKNIRLALAGIPPQFPRTITSYLWRHKLVTNQRVRADIARIFELAPRVGSVNRLCHDLYMSRRTLGRHFEACSLPVPSHWLQFARLLHVVLRSQAERLAIFKIALSMGYPDGFTLSNQLKRMTGFRPSEIRNYVGFEWLVDRWLDIETRRRGQSAGSNDD